MVLRIDRLDSHDLSKTLKTVTGPPGAVYTHSGQQQAGQQLAPGSGGESRSQSSRVWWIVVFKNAGPATFAGSQPVTEVPRCERAKPCNRKPGDCRIATPATRQLGSRPESHVDSDWASG
ncbi:hypothetical protein CABS01_13731 [Colletotrichum abscissum]|uniref:Uncharacterized protein n=1 Tax=Colletotrichum abscissum TaxID=1671311 RepID=A0A9P9XTF7_9PEZI|nr:uncharacterized protein CABS01_13731 [Colletotrichum abscissum]KAI3559092.1 hypothetical protein CABS02_00067 [Colletotrichum abscissum]KAK1484974.1 hypothetical protein CABS01_13731 [Colletotrichum abscissum]